MWTAIGAPDWLINRIYAIGRDCKHRVATISLRESVGEAGQFSSSATRTLRLHAIEQPYSSIRLDKFFGVHHHLPTIRSEHPAYSLSLLRFRVSPGRETILGLGLFRG